MKKLKLTLALVTAIVGFSSAARADTRYPLTCRGGGAIRWELNRGYDTWVGANSVKDQIMLTFAHAKVASSGGLLPGQCAWSDRPLSSTEPTMICMTVAYDLLLAVGADGVLRAFTENGTGVIDGLKLDSQYMTFWVYNDKQGCLRQ
jgi:hypothetical protein